MLKEEKMRDEAHQRRKKMVLTMTVGDDEDDVDPTVHYTKGEIG